MAQRDMNTLIKCEHCGEYYSATYKECPFCDDFEDDYYQDDYQETPRRRSTHGGRRLVTNKRGGGYGRGWGAGRILLTIASIGMIIAAIWIVFTVIKPLIDRGHVDPDNPPSPPVSDESPLPSEDPIASDEPEPSPNEDPEPSGSDIPADQTATAFTLSHTDFSFSNQYPAPITIKVSFFPAGSTGYITWTSSDPDIASVDENGKVSHGTKAGTTTITATMAGGAKQTCTVRSTISGTPTTTTSPSPSPSASVNPNANLSLNKTDFTFSSLSEPAVQMKVNGTSSTPSWSIGNTSVATISSDGKVRPVGNGTTNITCTVDGQTLKCIVRVNLR